MRVCKVMEFEAAHKLPNYDGDCKRLHGHSYKVEVEVSGLVKSDGMVMDLKILKENMKYAVDMLDHSYLNDMIPTPTAENIVGWLLVSMERYLHVESVEISRIKLWETSNSYVEWRREDK